MTIQMIHAGYISVNQTVKVERGSQAKKQADLKKSNIDRLFFLLMMVVFIFMQQK